MHLPLALEDPADPPPLHPLPGGCLSGLWSCWCPKGRQPFRGGISGEDGVSLPTWEGQASRMSQPAAGALAWPSLPRTNIHPEVTGPRHAVLSVLRPLRHEFTHSLIHSFHTNLKSPQCPSPRLILLPLSFPSLGSDHDHIPLSL